MKTNQHSEKNKAILESRADDLVHTLGDFFIDIHYRDERNKKANQNNPTNQKKDEVKKISDEKKDHTPPKPDQGTPMGGMDFTKLFSNPANPTNPPQTTPQQPPQPPTNLQQSPPKSILTDPKTKKETPMSGLFSGLKKKENAKVTFDHMLPAEQPDIDQKPPQADIRNVQVPTIPENTVKTIQNVNQPPPKMATPFYSQNKGLLDDEDDPLEGRESLNSSDFQSFCEYKAPNCSKN